MTPRAAYLITAILSDDDARLPAFGDHSALQIGRPAAAKTGTTTDFRDNWTIGYTPDIVVGVWVGNADNSPMVNMTGVTGAGPIWNEFLRLVLKGQAKRPFERPEGLIEVEVCVPSGLLPTPYCPIRKLETFIAGMEPTAPDNLYRPVLIDTQTGGLATESTPPERRAERVIQVLPQEARNWALRHGIEPVVGVFGQDGDGAGESEMLRLLMPDPYTIFQLAPQMPFEVQKIRFAVAVPPEAVRVAFVLNGETVGTANGEPWWVWWELRPGQHELRAIATLRDGDQQISDLLRFTVISFAPPDEAPLSGEVKP